MNFQNPYSRSNYTKFLQGSFLTDNFKIIEEEISLEFKSEFIKKATLIGRDKSLELEIYEIQHESENNPRVGISKEFFRLMASYGSKRGLAIFHSPNSKNFRLSLATVDLSLEDSRVKREYSNPRRFSFFLGPDAKVHTPYNFLIKKGIVKNFEDLQARFSIEVVNNEFYKEIANWYFWALKKIKFPDDGEAEKNGREISVIRLITRLIFIWFMKVRKLVPEELFDEQTLEELLTDHKLSSDNYYKAILQNLFFATLNTKKAERRFTSKKKGYKGFSHDFGNHNVYRYEELFKNSEEAIEKYFMPIPFLNGGLFECLDYKSKTRDERKYIDGFTSTKSQQPSAPNYLFFNDDKIVTELNKDYGTVNKKYNVRGLIKTLSLYNFTIDESDPNDADVALDPELLGKVFENLLASYNPETAKTARKSTGSYYTPRPIVDYMVDESLKQYFKTHLESTDSIPAVGHTDNPSVSSNNFFNPNDEIDIHQGNLPHWQQKDVWYFVTFRFADSLPKEIVEQIKTERELWLKRHKKEETKPYSVEELKEYHKLFSERIENLLDECKGSCLLREEKIAKIVADALLYFNNDKYVLYEWVIMPNHVHILVKPINEYTLPEITHSWKSFSANEINKLAGKSGQLWLHESYDHIVRNEAAFIAIKNYIRNNPVKAKLKLPNCAQSWTYSTRIIPDAGFPDAGHPNAEVVGASGTAGYIESKIVNDTQFVGSIESKDALALDTLFSNEEQTNPFDSATTKKLVNLIDSLRVVDPAVGSGAFPMRILNRLVFLLHKLDPDNALWKQSQIDGIKKSVKDRSLQRKFIEETERKFKEKNPNYGRKLYLIEKCIYGVDIQQIAVEIAKLRFFISLLVDEKIENGEIEPLPNLDFKLMQGNSLISSFAGIDFTKKPQNDENLFDFDEKYKLLIDDFEELKSQYQNEPDVHKKSELRDEIDAKLLEIFEEKLRQHYPQINELESKYGGKKEIIEAEKKKLFKKIGIDVEQAEQDLISYSEGRKQKDFFLWDVYFAEVFAEKGGFDIVIGNPPYGATFNEEVKAYLKNTYPIIKGQPESYEYFIFQCIRNFNHNNGICALIVPSNFIESKRAQGLRTYLLSNGLIRVLSNFRFNVWENNAAETMIFIFHKNQLGETLVLHPNDIESFIKGDCIQIFDQKAWNNTPGKRFIIRSNLNFLNSLSENTVELGSIVDISQGIIVYKTRQESEKNLYISDSKKSDAWKKLLDGSSKIEPYKITWGGKFLHYGDWLWCQREERYFNNPKILFIRLRNKSLERKLIGSYDEEEFYNRDNFNNIISKDRSFSLKFILALFNSKLINYWYKSHFDNVNINPEQVRMIPIKNLTPQQPFIIMVDNILTIKQQNPQSNTKHLEDQIDIMVYKLYELTYEGVKIIDPEIEKIISEEEYEKLAI
jgi:REP element-mobilizing transposase RayT